MVLKFIAWIHLVVFRLAAWLAGVIVRGFFKWVLVVAALLGEEFRRYAGLALSGTLIVVFGKLILALPDMPGKRPALLVDVLFLAVWALAIRRSVRHTMRNNLERVRARSRQKKLAGEVSGVYERMPELLAKKSRGTPFEMAWSSNRSAREEERAAAERAAEQAEADRSAAAERDRRDRASRAERDRELEMLAAEHNPFE